MNSNSIILIGGAPCTGKSTLARALASQLKINWISTDMLRHLMINLVRQEDYPNLFLMANDDPVDYLSSHSIKEIIDEENARSVPVYKILELTFKRNNINSWNSFIMEGISITPEFVVDMQKKDYPIKHIFLIDENQDRIRSSIYERGLWDEADKYPDSIKEKEVEWVVEYNSWIKRECEKYSLNCIQIDQRENLKDLVLENLIK